MDTSRADGVKAPQHRGTPRSHAMAHEFRRPAGPVVVAHLEADAVVYFLKVREAARILPNHESSNLAWRDHEALSVHVTSKQPRVRSDTGAGRPQLVA